jgi:hypothetical protein
MTPRRVSGTAKILVSSVLGVLLLAGSAEAAPITINFTGTVDLSSEGGLANNTVEGSITWNPNAVPFEVEPDFSAYDPISYTLFFNGNNVGGPVIGDGTGSGIVMVDDADPFGFGGDGDAFLFFLDFEVGFPLNTNGETDIVMIGVLSGPTGMFGSRDLPANLDFLSQLTFTGTIWMTDDEELLGIEGPLDVSAGAVPEPTLLTLMGLGLAAAFARGRRKNEERRTKN